MKYQDDSKALLNYILSMGVELPGKTLELYNYLTENPNEAKERDWINLYTQLSKLIAPAKPCTIILLMSNKKNGGLFSWLGPVPLLQNFILVLIISLIAFLSISISPAVNYISITKGIFTLQGWELVSTLIFLLAASSIGASFSALYKANEYIIKGTFEPKFDMTYWVRYFLGIVSGIILSELISPSILANEPTENIKILFVKPLFALLGGFSATAVYQIMNTMVEYIERLFKNNSKKMLEELEKKHSEKISLEVQQMKYELALKLLEVESKLTNEKDKELIKGLRDNLDLKQG